ncbi:hypothetical protein RHGRI_018701 [Rhododendron griersonianum]|uniref:Small ribosomal subunit protein uS10 domain-containing protein n=1 Tax=Rhododendron griersonianum TaxID=479676 RepID=A0AAV6K2C6_9ERIC|nr:hypothetical protein RHGRI_018701 [Rhododendron griersonianum]
MAFYGRLGSLMRQTVSQPSGQVPMSSMLDTIRCMSSTKLTIKGLSFGTNDDSLKDLSSGFGWKIGLPKSRVLYTVLRSPHIDKKSREQFEMVTKKKLLVMNTDSHELRQKLFWLKRQRIFGTQCEILVSCKTRLDKGQVVDALQRSSPTGIRGDQEGLVASSAVSAMDGQQIWDEVGESDEERDKMLLQLEQECLDVYKRKVDQAAKSRAQLLQTLADANVELSSLISALGERSFVGIVSSYPIIINAYWFFTPDKSSGTIKEQLAAVAPTLEQLWKQKEDRIKDFFDVQSQIQKIRGEIVGTSGQIAKAKEEALSRKDILDKVEKWMSACEEESWLEDYNRVLFLMLQFDYCMSDSVAVKQDDNRYNASRGAHLNLKRAEKARVLVNKIPVLVETLVAKTRAWEEDRGLSFAYDGVPLLAMLDEYAMLRHDREEEKRRMRDQKKFHEQLNTEQEAIFGSRPSPSPARASLGTKKVVGPRANGGANGTPRRLSMNPHQNGSRSINRDGKRDSNTRPVAPVNYVAISKEDAASHISAAETVPASP